MANRYAEWKLQSSLAVKRLIIDVVRLSARQGGPSVVSQDWNVFMNSVKSIKGARTRVKNDEDIPAVTKDKLVVVKLAPKVTNSSSSDTSSVASSSSSSEGTSSGDGEDIGTVYFAQADHGKGRLHLLSSRTEDIPKGSVRCKCRRLLVKPFGGRGLSCALERALSCESSWSPRCFAKLPRPQRDWWKRELAAKAHVPEPEPLQEL